MNDKLEYGDTWKIYTYYSNTSTYCIKIVEDYPIVIGIS